jgi:TolB-like protein
MTDRPSLVERLRRARIVQVLVVYLGASWAVLQVADLLQSGLDLPEWVMPVSVILLLIGLVIILATAWVQALPSTTAKEEAGEVPSDWEIAPKDAVTSLLSGELPHLTWGRSILGGAVALSLCFGVAGLYVMMKGPITLGPEEAGADEAATGIAVVPFSVSGEDLDVWREGMVDLLSTNLDGLGGFRAIDSRTVLARWRSSVGDAPDADLGDALRVAGATGARYALVGSAVSLGGRVRLTGEVYDVADGEKIGQAQVEGQPGEVLSLADGLAVAVVRELLGSEGSQVVSRSQVASLSTSSVEALRSYLEGESLIRGGEFERAASAYEEAVDRDSTFASAYYRLTSTYGWMEAGGDRAIPPPGPCWASSMYTGARAYSGHPRTSIGPTALPWSGIRHSDPTTSTTPRAPSSSAARTRRERCSPHIWAWLRIRTRAAPSSWPSTHRSAARRSGRPP